MLMIAFSTSPVWAAIDDAIERHCTSLGLVPALVRGVIETESRSNPLAIGVQYKGVHRGYFPQDRAYAQGLLGMVLKFTDNVGIGLMQINWAAWGKTLPLSPHDLLEPETNLRVGCQILRDELIRYGVETGIGAYHSPTPWRREGYARTVQQAIRKEMGQ